MTTEVHPRGTVQFNSTFATFAHPGLLGVVLRTDGGAFLYTL